ncbi:MAG: hypothetical protein ACTSP4_13360 [Candidatus Hodarchaeales archaeon]
MANKVNLDKFFSGKSKKPEKKKKTVNIDPAKLPENLEKDSLIQDHEQLVEDHLTLEVEKKDGIQPIVSVNEQIPSEKPERQLNDENSLESAEMIEGFEHKWQSDWFDNISKKELYLMLKETVEANRKFESLRYYIEKQMILTGSLDSTELAIRLNLTEGEILIIFDSIWQSQIDRSK